MRYRIRIAARLFLACILSFAKGVLADGIFQSVTGDVRAAEGAASLESVSAAQRFQAGARIATGDGGRAVLRFDDGHILVLYADSEIRVARYAFDRDRPERDAMRLELVSGALRSVTGLLGERSADRFALSTPQASFGLKGTDFMVMLSGAAYLSVLQGTVTAGDRAGTATFERGSLARVVDPASLASPLASSDLPRGVSEAFAALAGVAVGPGIEPRSGGSSPGAFGAASGANVAATAAAFGLAVAAVAAAASSQTVTASHH